MTTSESASDLIVEKLVVTYGVVRAVRGISLVVPAKSVVALLGANGAGKSSMLSAVAGNSEGTTSGDITLFGHPVKPRKAYKMSALGVALVPEGRQVFAPLSVEENLLIGAFRQRSKKRAEQIKGEVFELFPVLADRRAALSGLLSGGEQQMLAFGRAMMSDPRLILMDEPSMGLAPVMVDRVMAAVRDINSRGTSILLVEQNAAAALDVASYGYVLDQGKIVHEGPSADLKGDPVVAAAFLGLREEDPTPDPISAETTT